MPFWWVEGRGRGWEVIRAAKSFDLASIHEAAKAARVRMAAYPHWQRAMCESVSRDAASEETLATLERFRNEGAK